MSLALQQRGVVGALTSAAAAGLSTLPSPLPWPALFAGAHAAFFYLHYLFASKSAHVGALYAAFLSLLLAGGARPCARPAPAAPLPQAPVRQVVRKGGGAQPAKFCRPKRRPKLRAISLCSTPHHRRAPKARRPEPCLLCMHQRRHHAVCQRPGGGSTQRQQPPMWATCRVQGLKPLF